jgi:uncharacterized protein YcbX
VTSRPSRDAIDPVVARLTIFPFKALTGVDITAAALTPRGSLTGDRQFALFDQTGVVNAKRDANVHALRVTYDETVSRAGFTSTLTRDAFSFRFDDEPRALEAWLAHHFGRPIEVRRQPDGGFPDDTAAPGPTVVSTATLAAVAAWFPGLDVQNVRARLRTSIEIGDVPAFWEDRLYGAAGTAKPFRLGGVTLEGTNPCQRCIVPSRDPDTGAPILGFAKRVAEGRLAALPAWADRSRFDHYYRLAVNTRPAPLASAGVIRLGDAVRTVSSSVSA